MKLSLKQGNNILGIIGIILGIVIVALAFVQELPFTKKGLPGSGFFPILCGVAISVCGILILFESHIKSKRAKEENPEDKDDEKNIINMTEIRNLAYTIGVSIFVLVATPIIGMLFSIGISVVVMIKFLGKESIGKSILIGAGTTIVLYLIFDMFLGVPMPSNILGI